MPYYPPLYMPKPTEAEVGLCDGMRRWLSFRSSTEELHLLNQLRVREPIPSEVWGDDPNRAEFGREMAALIAARIDWPNDHFIPEDPFEWVTYVIGGEDLEHTEIIMALEENLGITIDDEYEWGSFLQWTFGEVVDYLRTGALGHNGELLQAMPLAGPQSMESNYCPKLASLIEIRKLLKGHRLIQVAARVTPSTKLRDLSENGRRYLDLCIGKRFECGVSPFRPYAPKRTALNSAFSTLMASAIFGLFGSVVALFSGANVFEVLLVLGLCAAIASFLGGVFLSLELFVVLSTPDYWRVRSHAYRRVDTVRDLIDWLIAERAMVRMENGAE